VIEKKIEPLRTKEVKKKVEDDVDDDDDDDDDEYWKVKRAYREGGANFSHCKAHEPSKEGDNHPSPH